MSHYIRIVERIPIYTYHTEDSITNIFLESDDVIEYNREKRRNKINWLEIYLKDGQSAYIKKEIDKIYFCKYCRIEDNKVLGIKYVQKTDQKRLFIEIFTPVNVSEKENILNSKDSNIGLVEFKTLKDTEEFKKISFFMKYDKNMVEVQKEELFKEDEFLLLNERYQNQPRFLEIEVYGQRSVFSTNILYEETKNLWLKYVYYIVVFAIIIGMIVAILSTGYLFISSIMIFPAILIGFIIMTILKLFSNTLFSIFNQIRKRF